MSEWKDAPSWVHDAAKREGWLAREWDQWEKLRERFESYNVRLDVSIVDGKRVTLIQAVGPVPFTASRPSDTDERPVLEALHRLCNQLGNDELEARNARIDQANARLRELGYEEDELCITGSVFGDDVVWFEGTHADRKPNHLTSGEMLDAIQHGVDPKTPGAM